VFLQQALSGRDDLNKFAKNFAIVLFLTSDKICSYKFTSTTVPIFPYSHIPITKNNENMLSNVDAKINIYLN